MNATSLTIHKYWSSRNSNDSARRLEHSCLLRHRDEFASRPGHAFEQANHLPTAIGQELSEVRKRPLYASMRVHHLRSQPSAQYSIRSR